MAVGQRFVKCIPFDTTITLEKTRNLFQHQLYFVYIVSQAIESSNVTLVLKGQIAYTFYAQLASYCKLSFIKKPPFC